MQDYILFLHWRSFSPNRPSLIPWAAMREQLWQDDKTHSRIRARFADAVRNAKDCVAGVQQDVISAEKWNNTIQEPLKRERGTRISDAD